MAISIDAERRCSRTLRHVCGCLAIFLGAVFPRFTLVLVEMFSNWNDRAFDSFWIGFVGWLFVPYATLAFSVMNALGDPISGFGWVIVAMGLLADVAGWFGTGRRRQKTSTHSVIIDV